MGRLSPLWRRDHATDAAGNRRKRVIVSIYDDPLNPHYAGGGPLVIQRIVESLVDRYDVVVVTGGHRHAHRSKRHRATYIPLQLGWAGPRIGQLLYTAMLMLIAPLARYDLWIESFTPPISSSFIPLVTRRPVIGLAQALSGRAMAHRYGLGLFPLVERLAVRAYSDIVVFNDYDWAQVSRWSPGSRVHHIPNVVRSVLPPDTPTAADGRYALYLGRIEFDQKGLGLLFEAYGRLSDSALPLVIAGSGRATELQTLRKALTSSGPRVSWLGYVDGAEKQAALADCAFVVIPSREESFCLVALEALAHGRPVVHFDLPQLAWIPQDCGVKIARFDVEELAAGIHALSLDLSRRATAGCNAYGFAQRFHGSQAEDPYGDLIDGVLSGTAPDLTARTSRGSKLGS